MELLKTILIEIDEVNIGRIDTIKPNEATTLKYFSIISNTYKV